MAQITAIIALLFSLSLFAAEDISLTIEDYDFGRQTASIMVLDSSQVPLGTTLRVNAKSGDTCSIKITERVNDHLVGVTKGCAVGAISPGMKLAYTPVNVWEQNTTPEPYRAPASESQVSYNYDSRDLFDEILERTSVHIGHNFASELEGNVRADGSIRNLDGDTALSIGVKHRAYNFNNRLWISGELAYESPRTFDRATYTGVTGNTSVGGTQGYSPRLSLWTLAALGEAQVMDRMVAFAGINVSLPSLSNSPFGISGDIGFQGGASYSLIPNVAIEGLVKITNMDFDNNIGETTDVSLAGFELRGRYNF